MRKRKKKNSLVEHIADYADLEYDYNSEENFIKEQVKEDEEVFDDSDCSWMYEDGDYKCEEEECDDEERELTTDSVTESVPAVVISDDIDKYMDAAAWFNEMSKRGVISNNEKRYVELMIIELSKFIDKFEPSERCIEAISAISASVRG